MDQPNDMADGMLAPNHKPRYFNDETISLTSDGKQRTKMRSFCCPKFICFLCCESKSRALYGILFVAILYTFFNAFTVDQYMETWLNGDIWKRKTTASKQSFGFFTSIPQGEWRSKQRKVKIIRKQQSKRMKEGKKTNLVQYSDPSKFYERNWPLEFTCPTGTI